MDQTDPWQVVPRQVFTPYDCLLMSVALAVLCPVGCLWETSVRLHAVEPLLLFERFLSPVGL